MKVTIVKTGLANIASVRAVLERLGAECQLSDSIEQIHKSERLVLPGVGAFGAGMKQLRACGLIDVLQERVRSDLPTLAICLGLQLLCAESEETPGVQGLSCIPTSVGRFSDAVNVPQLGWNMLNAEKECRFLRSGYVYYANSYRIVNPPNGWQAATSEYDGTFCGAIEKGAVLGCQFHPELSGDFGAQILNRWLKQEGDSC